MFVGLYVYVFSKMSAWFSTSLQEGQLSSGLIFSVLASKLHSCHIETAEITTVQQ